MSPADTKRFIGPQRALLLTALLVVTWLFTRNGPLRVDEGIHYHQISLLAAGEYVQAAALTAIPGYHWLMAQFVRVAHSDSIAFLRGINVLLGAACVLLFARCRDLLGDGDRGQRVLQFALCPIIFPFFFLIYNDIASLLLILAGAWLGLKRRYALAAVVLTLSLAVRQNNVVWLLAVPAVTWLQQTGVDYSWRNLRAFARAYWWLGIGLLLFAAFVVVNHGIAMGDRSKHPLVLGSGNVFFLLFVYSLVFLPLVLARTPANVRTALAGWRGGLLLAGFFVLYLSTFESTHPYNNIGPEYFLRNAVLMAVAGNRWLSLLFFVPVVLAALELARSMHERPILVPVVLASIAVVVPSWLIEQRYYIVSFALLLLFRPEGGRRADRSRVDRAWRAARIRCRRLNTDDSID